MDILLTNDDGINSQGINTLYKHLSEKHSVYIIAPDREKSGCSSAITMKDHIKIREVSENKYSVHGFTADCVNIGLKGKIIPPVNLVISGINHGPNCGDDIYFSGTVAGARIGYIYGISSIAISLDCYEDSPNFEDASAFLLSFINDINVQNGSPPRLYNINHPDLPGKDIKGVKYTGLGKRDYRDSYSILHRDDNEIKLQFNGGIMGHEKRVSDITELENGYITITPLTIDCTDYEFLKNLNQDN